MALLCGCSSYDVSISEDVKPREKWSVAVLPLNDAGARQIAADYTLFGATGGQGSGLAVARLLARSFASDANFQPASESMLRLALQEEKVSLRDCAHIDEGQACRLGRKLRADMVIRGRVATYRTSWFLFFPRSEVRLDLQAYDPAVSRVLWTATISDYSHLRSESDLVLRIGKRIFSEVRPKLVAKSTES